MGLLLFGRSASPSLGIGVTSAVFQSDGNVHVTKEALTIDVIAGRIGILSIPGALLDGIDVIMHSICLLFMAFNVNCSAKG